jgi:hypothetical protein
MHLLLLAALAVDRAADNPPAEVLAREKAAAKKLAEMGFEVETGKGGKWTRLAEEVSGVSPDKRLTGHVTAVRLGNARTLAPRDLTPFRDLPWAESVQVYLTRFDAEVASHLAGPRRYRAGALTLCGDGLDGRPCVVQEGALKDLLRQRPGLRSLGLSNVELTPASLRVLSCLTALRLSKVKLGPEHIEALCDLKSFPTLQSLSLMNCGVGDEDAAGLKAAWRGRPGTIVFVRTAPGAR